MSAKNALELTRLRGAALSIQTLSAPETEPTTDDEDSESRSFGGVTFRFNAVDHEYTDAYGVVLPHITGLLEQAGWIDSTWFSEESCERGQMVHSLTADYDLGALHLETCVSRYRPYLLGHVKVAGILAPIWSDVEVPMVHPRYRFGGRPDRVGQALSLRTVLEVKSGVKTKSHGIQLALQAILAHGVYGGLPPEHYQRLAEYLTPKGKGVIELFKDQRDVDEAYRILRRCCGSQSVAVGAGL